MGREKFPDSASELGFRLLSHRLRFLRCRSRKTGPAFEEHVAALQSVRLLERIRAFRTRLVMLTSAVVQASASIRQSFSVKVRPPFHIRHPENGIRLGSAFPL